MAKESRSTSIEEVLADYRKDAAYQKAERLISAYYELATQIINRRVELGLTQKDLAEKADTFQSRISKIESGEHDIRFSTLIDIAEALNCEVTKNMLVPLDGWELINVMPFNQGGYTKEIHLYIKRPTE